MGTCQTRERAPKGKEAPKAKEAKTTPIQKRKLKLAFKKKGAKKKEAPTGTALCALGGSIPQFIHYCEHGNVGGARAFTGDVNEVGPAKETGLTAAARRGQGNVVEMLVRERGARLDLPDGWGYLPLDRAVAHGRLDLVARMVKLGADLTAPNKFGWTALMYAGDRPTMVTLLVRTLGASPNPSAARLKFQPVSGDRGSMEALCRAGWEAGEEVDLNSPHSTIWRPRAQAKQWVSVRRQRA